MKRKLLMLLPALAVMIAMSLTACSDKTDATETDKNESGTSTSLTGSWYGEYEAEGETTAGTASIAGTYTKAAQGLQFNDDGTGTCTQVLCNIASEPLSIYGGTMDKTNGRFHYSTKADGTITITRDGDGDKTHPKTWTMKLADGVLSGTDGTTAFEMKKAEDYQLSYLSQWEETLRGGGNSEKNTRSFLTDWANCETVLVNGMAEPQYLPWAASSSAKSDIPEEVALDINPANGWEMAFCALSDPSAPLTRYFGLYNKYRGLLRVFMFVTDAQAYGNEMVFSIGCGTAGNNRYPFYNSMEYSIPVNKSYDDLNVKMDLVTCTSKYTAFSWYQTPYSEMNQATGVMPYWHCIDIDMTGYNPKSTTKWRNHIEGNRELLYIYPKSQNTSTMTLTGTLVDQMKGQFNSTTQHIVKYSNATNHNIAFGFKESGKFFTSITGLANTSLNIGDKVKDWPKSADNNANNNNGPAGGDDFLAAAVTRGVTAGTIAFVIGAIGVICSTTGAACEYHSGKEEKDSTYGNIQLFLNAQIDLVGQIKEWKSLSDGALRITPAMLKKTNPNCHIGDGCFGLEAAPKVYVASDALLSESDHLSLCPEKDSAEYAAHKAGKDLRFITVLDPNSVKINLNTDIYKNIRDLHVSSFISVDANRQVGHTDSYGALMKMPERPTIYLGKPDAHNTVELNTTTSSVKLYQFSKEEVMKDNPMSYPEGAQVTQLEKDFAAPKEIDQLTSEPYCYYGSAFNAFGSHYVIDPQAYLPYTGKKFLEPAVPDFVVTVIVQFKCDNVEKYVTLVKHFIPEYVKADSNKMKELQKSLNTYYNNCGNSKPVGTVVNAPSIKIHDNIGYLSLYKAVRTLKLVYGEVK